MTVIVVLVVLTAALGLASALGWTYDSRDPEYSLGRVLHPHPRADELRHRVADPARDAESAPPGG